VDENKIIKAICNYSGIARRFEYAGKLDGGAVICDYAHHPSEIEAVLRCARDMFKGVITAVFQPHTYSRTKAFMDKFAKCFDLADRVVLLPVYAARESYDAAGSSAAQYEKLSCRRANVNYLDSFRQAEMFLRRNKSSCIMILGAGDIVKLGEIITS
jgi:UDP-N-acetylmuramate--alanine ligase